MMANSINTPGVTTRGFEVHSRFRPLSRWLARPGVHAGRRHDDGLLAGRAIDLHSRIAGVALDLLAALRTVEFEFSHKFYWPRNAPASNGSTSFLLRVNRLDFHR